MMSFSKPKVAAMSAARLASGLHKASASPVWLLRPLRRLCEHGADAQPSLFIKFVEHRAEMLGDRGVPFVPVSWFILGIQYQRTLLVNIQEIRLARCHIRLIDDLPLSRPCNMTALRCL